MKVLKTAVLAGYILCFAAGCKEDCFEKVTLLPEGVYKAYKNIDTIALEIGELDEPRRVNVVTLVKSCDADVYLEESSSNPNDCSIYSQVHHVCFTSPTTSARLDYYLAQTEEEKHLQLGAILIVAEYGVYERYTLDHMDFKLNEQEPSGTYKLRDGGSMRFNLDSGFVWAKTNRKLIKRIL